MGRPAEGCWLWIAADTASVTASWCHATDIGSSTATRRQPPVSGSISTQTCSAKRTAPIWLCSPPLSGRRRLAELQAEAQPSAPNYASGSTTPSAKRPCPRLPRVSIIGHTRVASTPATTGTTRVGAGLIDTAVRLLFVLYAESSHFLPVDNETYQRHSLTELVAEAHKTKSRLSLDSTALWKSFTILVGALRAGNPAWGVPAYNGACSTRPILRGPSC